jgi:hypothetical protein
MTKDTLAAIRRRFRLRSMVMRRHYRHRLGVTSVPGTYGRQG